MRASLADELRLAPWRASLCVALVASACADKPGGGAGSTSTGTGPAAPTSATATASATGSTSATAMASATGEPLPVVTGSAVGSASAAPTSAPTAKPSAAAPVPNSSATASPVASTAPTSLPTSLPAPAPGSADAVAADIDALYLPKKTFKAKFTQKYKQKITGTEKESHGVVFVEKPNKISFRYDPPNKNRIVSDGTSVKVYIADDAQMFEQPVRGTEYPGALSFIMGEGVRTSFSFTFNEKAKFDKGPVLVGKPLVESPSYESALFYVDKDKLAKKDLGAMVAVLIVDAQGNKNRFEFSEQETPDKIDPAEFTFTPPPGTNVQK
jgi:outer membrane lipoprotein carrier protein